MTVPAPPAEYTQAGWLLVASGVMNMVIGAVWWVSLIFACGIGLCWTLPVLLGGVQVAFGLWMSAGRRMHNGVFWVVLGFLASLMNMNPFSMLMDGISVVLLMNQKVGPWLELPEHDGEREW